MYFIPCLHQQIERQTSKSTVFTATDQRLSELLFIGQLRSQTLISFLNLGRTSIAEICYLVNRPYLNLDTAAKRAALKPFDRLVHRLRLPQPEASDQFLSLSEGAVDYRRRGSGELNALASGTWLKSLSREHHPSLHQLFVVFSHCVKDFFVRKDARF